MRLSLLTLGCCLALAACQPGTNKAPAASAAASSASVAQAPAVSANATLVKGVYTFGPEVETFSPCGTDQTFWMNGDPALLEPLEEIALKKGDKQNDAYPEIYMEALVVNVGKATDGYAVDYDGVYELQRVNLTQKEVPESCELLDPPAPAAPSVGPASSAPASAAR